MKRLIAVYVIACTAGCGERMPGDSSEAFEWPDHLSPLAPEYALREDAPDFYLPVLTRNQIGGDSVRLSNLRGNVVLLNFWNTSCGPCVAEHETLNRLAERFGGSGVRFLGINSEDTPEVLARFEDRHSPTSYPNLFDSGESVGKSYRQYAWPLHVVVDAAGRVAWWHHGGPMKEQVLTKVLEDVLQGRRPKAETSAAYSDEIGS